MKIDKKTIVHEDISKKIEWYEKCSRQKFPKSYIKFIKKYNMGVPITNCFDVGNTERMIVRFLGLLNDASNSPLGNYHIPVVESQIGERLTSNPDLIGCETIPIAELFAGDYVCLDYRDNKDNPEVCVWYHEESGDFEPVTRKVSNTFDEFLKMLRQENQSKGVKSYLQRFYSKIK